MAATLQSKQKLDALLVYNISQWDMLLSFEDQQGRTVIGRTRFNCYDRVCNIINNYIKQNCTLLSEVSIDGAPVGFLFNRAVAQDKHGWRISRGSAENKTATAQDSRDPQAEAEEKNGELGSREGDLMLESKWFKFKSKDHRQSRSNLHRSPSGSTNRPLGAAKRAMPEKVVCTGLYLPMISSVLAEWMRQIYNRNDDGRLPATSLTMIVITGKGAPWNSEDTSDSNSTFKMRSIVERFVSRFYNNARYPLVHIEQLHMTNIFSFDQNVQFLQSKLLPRLAQRRAELAAAFKDNWTDHFHLSVALTDGAPARLTAIQAAVRRYRPDYLHMPQVKSFWYDFPALKKGWNSDVRFHNFDKVEIRPAKRRDKLTPLQKEVVVQLKAHRDNYEETLLEAHDMNFWLRKSKQPVLSILAIRVRNCGHASRASRQAPPPVSTFGDDGVSSKDAGRRKKLKFRSHSAASAVEDEPLHRSLEGVQKCSHFHLDGQCYKFFPGVNMEVSLPTGSLCSERNAIGSALADNPRLQREDCVMVAVLALPSLRKKRSAQPSEPSSSRTRSRDHSRDHSSRLPSSTPGSIPSSSSTGEVEVGWGYAVSEQQKLSTAQGDAGHSDSGRRQRSVKKDSGRTSGGSGGQGKAAPAMSSKAAWDMLESMTTQKGPGEASSSSQKSSKGQEKAAGSSKEMASAAAQSSVDGEKSGGGGGGGGACAEDLDSFSLGDSGPVHKQSPSSLREVEQSRQPPTAAQADPRSLTIMTALTGDDHKCTTMATGTAQKASGAGSTSADKPAVERKTSAAIGDLTAVQPVELARWDSTQEYVMLQQTSQLSRFLNKNQQATEVKDLNSSSDAWANVENLVSSPRRYRASTSPMVLARKAPFASARRENISERYAMGEIASPGFSPFGESDSKPPKPQSLNRNPIKPCGACTEWLRKIAEVNPGFEVLTFEDVSLERVFVEEVKM